MTAQNDLKNFTGKIQALLKDAAKQEALRPMAEQAIAIIQKRTRLGYGVPAGTNGTAERFKLPELSAGYVKRRKRDRKLSELTTPSRSNLTFTGQLLDSLAIVKLEAGTVVIGPTGTRKGGGSNAAVAQFVADSGRPFLALSRPEAEQLRRFYRNKFGDLQKNRRLS